MNLLLSVTWAGAWIRSLPFLWKSTFCMVLFSIWYSRFDSKTSKVVKFWRFLKAPWTLIINPADPWGIYKDVELPDGATLVRIVHLLPGKWEDPITCQLEEFDVTENKRFIALSYSWQEEFPGLEYDKTIFDFIRWAFRYFMYKIELATSKNAPNHTRHSPGEQFVARVLFSNSVRGLLEWLKVELFKKIWRLYSEDPSKRLIEVNGKMFVIGINLEMALRHLRKKKDTVLVWADAICINQDDITDRNRQVQGLGEMYRKAASVEIFLGFERDVTSSDARDKFNNDFQNRTVPTIKFDPRTGTDSSGQSREGDDLTWNYLEEDSFDSNVKTPSAKKQEPEYKLLKAAKKQWRRYHSLTKSRRISIRPRYTEQCFCMIHQLAYHAFKKCGAPTGNKRDLQNRVVFLLKDEARSAVLKVLEVFVNARWWTRIWVVQETVIADKVFVRYGGYRIQWELLVRAAKNLEKHRQKPCCSSHFEVLNLRHLDLFRKFADQVLSLETWRHVWRGPQGRDRKKIKLLMLLWRFRDRKTSDARDKVYALYSLVNDVGDEWDQQQGMRRLIPRYESTVEAVYLSTFNMLLQMEQNLNLLLGNARKSAGLRDKLPTWIPDWSEPPLPGEYERLQRIQHYSASGTRHMAKKVFPKAGVLRIRGIKLDNIQTIGTKMPEEKDEATVAEAQDVFREWSGLAGLPESMNTLYKHSSLSLRLIPQNEPPAKEELTKREAYGRLLCMDTRLFSTRWDEDMNDYINRYSRADRSYDDEMRSHESNRERRGTFDHDHISRNGQPHRASSIRDDFGLLVSEAEKSAVIGRAFFLTKHGYMGLGPSDIQENDLVVVVFGCAMPLIVRPAPPERVPEGIQEEEEETHATGETSLTLRITPASETIKDTPNSNSQDTRVPVLPTPPEYFILVGDAYVQGAMYGEAVEDPNEKGEFLYLV